MKGRPRKHPEGTAVVSARIPVWKRDILLLNPEITAEAVFNAGADLLIGNLIHQGRISKDGLTIHVKQLEVKRKEIEDQLKAAKTLMETRETRQSAAQLRVWDSVEEEVRIIMAAELNPAIHQIREVIK